MEQKGIGYGINKWASTEDILLAINTVLTDQKYSQNVQKLSELMKLSMKQKPMENALWWLEYLSATGGANHLKLSSRHLNTFQYFSIDFICIVFVIFYIMIKFLCRKKMKQKTD